MRKYGLVIDTEAIGKGMYNLIEERGQDAIVAFGMLPAEVMEMLERLIREKVINTAAGQYGLQSDEIELYVDEKKIKEIVNDITHQVCVEIYRAASAAGKMMV
ncbi:MAG: hypothetical protein AABZ39_04895 [Spirochaetota bacterium]